MTGIVTVVIVSLIGLFVYSLREAALYAVTPTRVEQLRSSGARGGRKLADWRERLDDAIAAVHSDHASTYAPSAGKRCDRGRNHGHGRSHSMEEIAREVNVP